MDELPISYAEILRRRNKVLTEYRSVAHQRNSTKDPDEFERLRLLGNELSREASRLFKLQCLAEQTAKASWTAERRKFARKPEQAKLERKPRDTRPQRRAVKGTKR